MKKNSIGVVDRHFINSNMVKKKTLNVYQHLKKKLNTGPS